jgi:hypothetical protein
VCGYTGAHQKGTTLSESGTALALESLVMRTHTKGSVRVSSVRIGSCVFWMMEVAQFRASNSVTGFLRGE